MEEFETAEETLEFIRSLGFTLLGGSREAEEEEVVEASAVLNRPCGREREQKCCGGKCGS